MFGMFKNKKEKSILAMEIKDKGLDQVTTEVAGSLMRQLAGTEYMYHFILAELDGASMGNEKARQFARESGIPESEYVGHHKFEHPLIDGPNGAKTFMDSASLDMFYQQDLVVDFRLMVLEKLMRQVKAGKYYKDIDSGRNFDGDRFWEWAQSNCVRVKCEPRKIRGWGDVKMLDFRANHLSEFSDDVLAHTGLVELNLFQNNFSSVPESIFFLTQLNHLNLGLNRITTLSDNISNLKNLKILDLEYNQITCLPSEIGELKNLEKLSINNNCLTSIPKEIGNMSELRHISLYNNDLSDLPDEILNLKNLKTLWLQDNNFSEDCVLKWTEKTLDTPCEISFGYQKNQITDPIRVVEDVKGGRLEDSLLAIYLNSVDGETVSDIFEWRTSETDKNFIGGLLADKKYSRVRISEGLSAKNSSGNITPIEITLRLESPSDEGELFEWVKIIYIQILEKYGLKPNSKLRIASVGTSGDEKTIGFMER